MQAGELTDRAERGSATAAALPVLEIENLQTHFLLRKGILRAVDGFSCSLNPGETLGIVGESGCGKSMTALSILRLVPNPPGKIVGGVIRFESRDLLALSETEMRKIRGNNISMIFQEPMSSLNPVVTIGRQISEAIWLHQGVGAREALLKTVEMLHMVRISEPERRLSEYPHQLSGGMRQRVMIAMALSCNPQVLLADEPTTALDVTIQAQILMLMTELQQSLGTAIMLITHDMGVIAEHADRVVVMYAGRKVEEAPVEEIFANPLHPYTHGLLRSVPRLDLSSTEDTARRRLSEIPGTVPPLDQLPAGCAFSPRCGFATDICRREYPPLEAKSPGHFATCWHSDQVRSAGP